MWLYNDIVIYGYICIVLWYYSMIYVWCEYVCIMYGCMILYVYNMYIICIWVWLYIWLYVCMNTCVICDIMCCIMWDCKCGILALWLWFQNDIHVWYDLVLYVRYDLRIDANVFRRGFERAAWLEFLHVVLNTMCECIWYYVIC